MRTFARQYTWAVLAVLFAVLTSSDVLAQDASQQEVTAEQLAIYTKAFAEIAQARDEIQAKLAAAPNKTVEAQEQLRESLKARSAEIIKAAGLTAEKYNRITWLISVDDELRKAFEEGLAKIVAEKALLEV